jgi:hypothetical protein
MVVGVLVPRLSEGLIFDFDVLFFISEEQPRHNDAGQPVRKSLATLTAPVKVCHTKEEYEEVLEFLTGRFGAHCCEFTGRFVRYAAFHTAAYRKGTGTSDAYASGIEGERNSGRLGE